MTTGPGRMARRRGEQPGAARRTRDLLAYLGFLAPTLIALAAFRIIPIMWVGVRSLRDAGGRFVGLENYRVLVAFPFFWSTVRTTVVFIVLTVIVQIGLALILAILLTQRLAVARVVRIIVFLPVAIPIVSSSVVWGAALRADGLVNALLGKIGIPAQPWINDTSQALISLVIVCAWIGVGFWMTFLIAGLGEIPSTLYEAALVDGAGWWQRLRKITIPMLRRPLFFVIVADTVLAAIVIAPVLILTNGGPSRATNMMMFDIYQRAFVTRDAPLAAAQTILLLGGLAVMVGIMFTVMRRGGPGR